MWKVHGPHCLTQKGEWDGIHQLIWNDSRTKCKHLAKYVNILLDVIWLTS